MVISSNLNLDISRMYLPHSSVLLAWWLEEGEWGIQTEDGGIQTEDGGIISFI